MKKNEVGNDKSGDYPILPTPRWVKVFGVTVAILILLFVFLHLTGNSPGGHGDSYRGPAAGNGSRK